LARFEETINNPGLYCVNPDHPDRPGDCLYPPKISNPILDLVVIMEGTNDLNAGTPYDLIEANLRTMVQIAHQQGLKAIIATISPVTGANRELTAQRIAEFNPRIWQIGNDYQIPVADIYTAFLNYPNWENILISEDGLHPNDQGFEIMAEAFYPTILSHMSPSGCFLSFY
jgi:lysophospholipase L1-like esterase